MTTNLEDRFIEIVRGVPTTMRVLETVRALDLPDWMVFSGAVYQPVWNHLTGRAPDYGIKDYDVAYHDDSDTSYEAEDVVIKRVAAAFEPPLRELVEVRNQARVHLWYGEKFGAPYPPLTRSSDGIDRFLMPCAQVGIRNRSSGYEVYAPKGLSDVADMIVRPNDTPNFQAPRYQEKTARWKALWPELTVIPAI